MRLFNIAKKNIKHDLAHYFLYFVSVTFCIMIYYLFVLLSTDQLVIKNLPDSDNTSRFFSFSSIFLVIFIALFIFYTIYFFTRKRKREIGIYSLLGLSKREIGRILFYENFLLGLLALIFGIIGGTLFSKLFINILLRLIQVNATSHTLFSWEALFNTFIVFILIIAFTSFVSFELTYTANLHQLVFPKKTPKKYQKRFVLYALLAVPMICTGYFIALKSFSFTVLINWPFPLTACLILFLITLGSYLFIRYTLILLFRIKRTRQSVYKGTSLITYSQLEFRVVSSIKTLTMVALVSAASLVFIGMISGFYSNTNSLGKASTPSTFEYQLTDKISQNHLQQLIKSVDMGHPVKAMMTSKIYLIKSMKNNHLPIEYQAYEAFQTVSLSTFNKINQQNSPNSKPASLKTNQAFFIPSPYKSRRTQKNNFKQFTLALANKPTVQLIKQSYKKPYSFPYGLLVVNDTLAQQASRENMPIQQIVSINVENPKTAFSLSAKIKQHLPENAYFNSYPERQQAVQNITGIILFIGIFISLVFIVSTGSVIYFKQLTHAYEDEATFKRLTHMGISKKEMKYCIAKQLFIIFFTPFFLGICHSSIILIAFCHLFNYSLISPMIISTGIYTLIYISYYLLTVSRYTRIVTEAEIK
ncbi:ABC transporter permease [Listeria sp. PSOL-1]|uniref:ABC transporter permease n=1 Tax=Listeria sp. PSOL-1 TaxID=1844999 RepID=UPI0013D15A25|nr:ABC transporter permease [Listeria sp. PSOL-1]